MESAHDLVARITPGWRPSDTFDGKPIADIGSVPNVVCCWVKDRFSVLKWRDGDVLAYEDNMRVPMSPRFTSMDVAAHWIEERFALAAAVPAPKYSREQVRGVMEQVGFIGVMEHFGDHMFSSEEYVSDEARQRIVRNDLLTRPQPQPRVLANEALGGVLQELLEAHGIQSFFDSVADLKAELRDRMETAREAQREAQHAKEQYESALAELNEKLDDLGLGEVEDVEESELDDLKEMLDED